MSDTPNPKKPESRRVRPTKSQERRVWDESGSRCQFCGTEGVTGLQIHHLDEDSSNTIDANLIAICGACHDRYKHGVISRNDAYRIKKLLVDGVPPYPALINRQKRKLSTKKTNIGVGINNGQVADKIVNNNYGERKAARIILPGSIAESPDHYNYLEYLMGRLAEFRTAGASFGQKRKGSVHVGVIRNMVKNEWGALPKNIRLERWGSLVVELKAKIEGTALGRTRKKRGQKCYSSFEEFLAKGKDDSQDRP